MNQHAQTGMARSRGCSFILGAVAMLCLLPAGNAAVAQNAPAPARAADNDAERARLLGLLVHTQVTISLGAVPAREAFDTFRRVTFIPIVARWNDDAVGFGMDPRTLISVDASNRPALDVLEEMLEQCELTEDCTWQLRRGFVEVSTKERLAVPAARETRLYDIRHLMLEAPMFAPPGNGSARESERKYNSAFTGRRMKMVELENGEWVFRKNPDELASEVVTAVVETVEPGMWDLGDDAAAPRADEAKDPGPASTAAPGGSGPGAGGAQPNAPLPRARTGVGQWATLRVWRDQMIIKAPDFVHRQIDGYPPPIKPEGDLRRTFDPNARGLASEPQATYDESKEPGRTVAPAPDGDANPPADTAAPKRPQGEPMDAPKSPGDRKIPNRPH
jgi:hypothetical protein